MSDNSRGESQERGTWQWYALIAGVIVLHLLALAYEACMDSPTVDEPAHLVAGISHWDLGRQDLYCVNPPLVRAIASVPALFMDLKFDWLGYDGAPAQGRREFRLGERFFLLNGARALDALLAGRLTCLPLSVLGALICCFWARDLYGHGAGLLALLLWCVSPNILAHAHLITPDVGATSLGLAASYVFWKWLDSETWEVAILVGLALGSAQLAKFTLVLLYPMWGGLFLVWSIRRFRSVRHAAIRTAKFATIILISLVVINSVYGFHGTGARISDRQVVRTIMQSEQRSGFGNQVDQWLLTRDVLIPLPLDYVTGVYVQKADFSSGRYSFLFGEWRQGGWWYYYLACVAIKTPVGFLVLLVASFLLSLVCRNKVKWFDEICLLAPAVCLFVFISSQTGINEHLRYVLVAFPYFFIAVGKSVWLWKVRIFRVAVVICLVWTCMSSAWCFPHSLSYFNELAGGPHRGFLYLSHSNTDWGQDLLYLKRRLERLQVAEPVHLMDAAFVDAEALGIDEYEVAAWVASRETPSPGWYALSVNMLQGNYFERLQECPLVDKAGYSIHIYRVRERAKQCLP